MAFSENVCCCEIKTGALAACILTFLVTGFYLILAAFEIDNAFAESNDNVFIGIKIFQLVFYVFLFISIIMYIVGLNMENADLMILMVVLAFADIFMFILDLYPVWNIQPKFIVVNVISILINIYIALVILAGWMHVNEES